MATLLEDIRDAINRHSAENASNTPDFILAKYLESCLAAFDAAVKHRDHWYGHDPRRALDMRPPVRESQPEPEEEAVTADDFHSMIADKAS